MSFMILSVRRRASRSSNNATVTLRNFVRPISMKNNVPKKMKTSPIAGVTIENTGAMKAAMSTPGFD